MPISAPLETRHISHIEEKDKVLHLHNIPKEWLSEFADWKCFLHERKPAPKDKISLPSNFCHVSFIAKDGAVKSYNVPEIYFKYLSKSRIVSDPKDFRHIAHLGKRESFNIPQSFVKAARPEVKKGTRRTISTPRDFKHVAHFDKKDHKL